MKKLLYLLPLLLSSFSYGQGFIGIGAAIVTPTFTDLGGTTGNANGTYSWTLTHSASIGSCDVAYLVNDSTVTIPTVVVTDSKSNTIPTTAPGYYAVKDSPSGSLVGVMYPVTVALTTSDTMTFTVSAGDTNTGVHAYNVSPCATSSIIDQHVTDDLTGGGSGTNAPTSSTLTPGQQPVIGVCVMATLTGSSPVAGNIIGSAATALTTISNASSSRIAIPQWRNITALTAGTCTQTGTGLNNWESIFVTLVP